MTNLNDVPETMGLNDIAGVLRVHPRTVLRHVTGNAGTYWAKGYSPDINTNDLILALGADLPALMRAVRGEDELLTPKEASAYLQVPHRTFSFRKYRAAIQSGKTVRYSSSDIANEHIDNYVKV